MTCRFVLNGEAVSVNTAADSSLLELLRERFALTGTKAGCGKGECGSCLVLLDGKLVSSCLIPAFRLIGRRVTTIEGLSDGPQYQELAGILHRPDCPFCGSGQVMALAALYFRVNHPLKSDIDDALSGNLCCCGGIRGPAVRRDKKRTTRR
jgi:carbon-monoxide dehydrogenase small subunit